MSGTFDRTGISKFTILRHFTEQGTFSPEQEAAMSDFWSGHYDVLHRTVELHKLNPNMICLLYRNIRTVWRSNHPWEYDSHQLQQFADNGWVLKDPSGNFVVDENGYGYLVDVGSPEYQNWLAHWLKSYIDQYGANGAFLDNCLASNEIMWGSTQTPINPRTKLAWTNQEWHNAVISLINTVKEVLGDKVYVIGNGVWSGGNWNNRLQLYQNFLLNSSIDGVLSEGWISDYTESTWYDETEWKKSIDMAVWVNDNFLSRDNKFFIALCANVAEGTIPEGATAEQYALFGYASLLLAISNNGNVINYGTYLFNDYVQSLFRTKIGTPINAYSIIPNTHVYARDFTDAKVLVNPTNIAYAVNLNGEYLSNNGTVSSLTIQPNSGIILKTK
jgi:hypothetical protein